MFNRRKSKRVEIALPLHIKLLGISELPPIIKTVTRNISPVGISMELPVTLTNGVFFIQLREHSVNLIRYLVQKDKEVELEITLPPHDKKFKARGKVIWYNFGSREGDESYYFGAGILLKEVAEEEKQRWEDFARTSALETGKVWQHIQFISALIFLAGIIIFIVGYYGSLGIIAKSGIFLSFIALVGFVIAWWQQRSFMHLKKYKLF
jgi:small-conductance mechanosensitive channel